MKSDRRNLFITGATSLGFYLFLGAVLFASAGTLHLPMFWAYLGEMSTIGLLSVVLVYLNCPDLLEERMKPGKGERDKGNVPPAFLLFVTHLVVAGFDVGRAHWSINFPLALQLTGLFGFALGNGFFIWAMTVNRFFSTAVRIQEERGQKVITSGPYQYVRHPGYTGGILFMLGSGFALGSWYATLPILLSIPFIVRRTMIEDEMLKTELEGFVTYAEKVRFRLIPGIW